MKTMLQRLFAILALLALAACGGGGGDKGAPPFGDGGGGGGGGGGTTAEYTVTVSLSTQTVTAAQPATVTAVVRARNGAPQVGQVVSFGTSGALGAFSASSALTNASGEATVILSPASSTSVGADTVLATATISGTAYVGSTGFQLTATNVTISAFTADIGAAALGAYAQTQLTVTLAGTSPSTPVNVAISSSCVTQGRATLTPPTASTSIGSATFTYRDNGCGAFNTSDGLQASVTGTAATAQRTITLTAPTVSSIAFVSSTPSAIFLKGSGFVENSNVVFQVRDANGLGVPNQSVTLESTTLAGGLLIDGGSVAVTKVTDSSGNVTVRINAGTVPTPVRVRATLGTSGISTVSSSLAVAVGLPSQLNFSLSQRTLNVEGFDRDGTTNTYTVIASDRLGNPVPEGTAMNFVAEGGQIEAIQLTKITNGLSSATTNFQTATPRPADGRVTVMVYALGEESFLDTNGDNVYTPGEDYQDLGDLFIDRLFNGTVNPAEDQFISQQTVGGTDPCRVASSTLLRLGNEAPSRVLSNTGATLNTCAAGWGRAYVRKASQTIFSTSAARPGWRRAPLAQAVTGAGGTCGRMTLIDQVSANPYAPDDAATSVAFYPLGAALLANMGKQGAFSFLASDANPTALNPVAAGSTISVTGTKGLTASALGTPVASSLNPTPATINYTFDGTTDDGTLTITITSPSGLAVSFSQPIQVGPATGLVACP